MGCNRAFPHRPTLFALEYDSSSLGDSDENLVLIIPLTPNILAEKIQCGMRGPLGPIHSPSKTVLLLFFSATAHMRGLSSQTRDRTRALCSGSMES